MFACQQSDCLPLRPPGNHTPFSESTTAPLFLAHPTVESTPRHCTLPLMEPWSLLTLPITTPNSGGLSHMTQYVARAAYKMPLHLFFLSSSFFTLPLQSRPNTSPRVNLFVDSRAQSLLRTPLHLLSRALVVPRLKTREDHLGGFRRSPPMQRAVEASLQF